MDITMKTFMPFLKGCFQMNKKQDDEKKLTQDEMYPGESNSENPPLEHLSESEKKKLQVKDGQNNLNVDERGGY